MPVERIEHARAALLSMDVKRFEKEGWSIIVYFDRDFSHRVIISKKDGTVLADKDIATFLTPNKSYNSWSQWKLSDRRAWVSEGKGGPYYAMVTKDAKILELLTFNYMVDLGQQVWLDSTEPKDEKPK